MKIINYMPIFLQNVREFEIISNLENEELEKLKLQIDNILKEVIVNTSEDYGLRRYEKIYNIDVVSDDIDVRRFNIISKINNKAPFTYKWLDNKLKQLVGENNYKIKIEYHNYKIIISIVYLFGDIVETLQKDLKELLPSNLIIQINLFSNCNLYLASIIHKKKYIKLEVAR